jgi:hypothetical protein
MTAIGRLFFVVLMLGGTIAMFLSIGYNSRDLRYNVQNYIESQQQDPFLR